ncbi:unnamed protein product, partial [marine sediment metagenome]
MYTNVGKNVYKNLYKNLGKKVGKILTTSVVYFSNSRLSAELGGGQEPGVERGTQKTSP